MVTKQAAGEIGELYVFSELLKRGATPYVPLVDEGVDTLVRASTGRIIELQIKSAGSSGGKYPRWFQAPQITPKKNFFIIGVEFEDAEPMNAWVLPSIIFDKYAAGPLESRPFVI